MEKDKLLDRLSEYQDGSLTGYEVLEVFSELVKSGFMPEVGSDIRRTAEILIDKGMLSPSGRILIAREEVEKDEADRTEN